MKINGTLCAVISRPATGQQEQTYYADIYDESQVLCRVKVLPARHEELTKLLGRPVEIKVSARAFKDTIYFTEV